MATSTKPSYTVPLSNEILGRVENSLNVPPRISGETGPGDAQNAAGNEKGVGTKEYVGLPLEATYLQQIVHHCNAKNVAFYHVGSRLPVVAVPQLENCSRTLGLQVCVARTTICRVVFADPPCWAMLVMQPQQK